jgi:hypothetical protein
MADAFVVVLLLVVCTGSVAADESCNTYLQRTASHSSQPPPAPACWALERQPSTANTAGSDSQQQHQEVVAKPYL